MKVRVTLMTENDTPAEKIGKTAEERNRNAEAGWSLALAILKTMAGETGERIELESVEEIDDAENE